MIEDAPRKKTDVWHKLDLEVPQSDSKWRMQRINKENNEKILEILIKSRETKTNGEKP